MSVQTVHAANPVNVKDIEGCRPIKANAERLLCYDTVADGGVFNQQQLKQVQRDNFGSKKKAPEISIEQLSVTVTSIKKDVNGMRSFFTSDGQVWKQTTAVSWSSKVPFEAEIKSGALGSFFLIAVEGGRSTRVKRIR